MHSYVEYNLNKMKTNTLALEQEMLELLNHERKMRNLNPLQPSGLLSSIARRHSQEQMSKKDIYHKSPIDGSLPHMRIHSGGYRAKASAENVGTAPTFMLLHNGLMNSPGHYKNIVGSWEDVGIGIVAENYGQLYVTQLFANPVRMVNTHLLLKQMLLGIADYRAKLKLKPIKTVSSNWLQKMASQPGSTLNNYYFEQALTEFSGEGQSYSDARIFMFDGFSNPSQEQHLEMLAKPELTTISFALYQNQESGRLKGVFLFLT